MKKAYTAKPSTSDFYKNRITPYALPGSGSKT